MANTSPIHVGSYSPGKLYAQASSITDDANIRGDQYLSSVAQYQRELYRRELNESITRQKKMYEDRKAQIRDHPELLDVFTGNALNTAFEQMSDPSISPSSRRTAKVPIPREVIRRIPFKLEQRGGMFSLQHLTARGKGKWPVAFQMEAYAPYVNAYERAIDKALDEMMDGKVYNTTITEYDQAVQGLLVKLDTEYEGRMSDNRYGDARRRIREMEAVLNLMKARKAEDIMAGIDRYNGQTVEDLREFMDKHHLKFAQVDDSIAEERELYVELLVVHFTIGCEVLSAFRSNEVGRASGEAHQTRIPAGLDPGFAESRLDGLTETDQGGIEPGADAQGILVWWGSPEARPTLRSNSDKGGF